MGIREYGRHRGVSHVAVLKALRTGRIRQTADGLIDSDQADRDWRRNTHPAPRAPRVMTGAADGGYGAARTVREHYSALLAKREYEERLEGLVSASEVKAAAVRAEQLFRETMLGIPAAVDARVQAYVSGHGRRPDEQAAHLILSSEIRTALELFADRMISISCTFNTP